MVRSLLGKVGRRINSALRSRVFPHRGSCLSAYREFKLRQQDKENIDILGEHFDVGFYRRNNPDLANRSAEELLRHFYFEGYKEFRDPCADFSVQYYLHRNSDVEENATNPFVHYLRYGKKEARCTGPAVPNNWRDLSPEQKASIVSVLDPGYYQKYGLDIQGRENLAAHYLETGWRQGFEPNAYFSGRHYHLIYPNTRRHCPLAHFLFSGIEEPFRIGEDQPALLRYEAGVQPSNVSRIGAIPAKAPRHAASAVKSLGNDGRFKVHWVVPDYARGSGGHMTIFRMVKFLEAFGYDCKIWIERPIFHATPAEAYDTAIKYYQCISAEIEFVTTDFVDMSADALIATDWLSAYWVNANSKVKAKFYFVQDHEPEFFPTSAERFLATQTYSFDLSCLCASPWLEGLMKTKYGRQATHFYLAYNKEVYWPAADKKSAGSRATGKTRIAVYARQNTARRCVELATAAIDILSQSREDFEVHFFGQETLDFFTCGFVAFNHGVISEEKLAELYRSCDIGICFSGTNYSLVPQEMMACGLPVLELDHESTRAIYPDDVVEWAKPDPLIVANKLKGLIENPERRLTIGAQALKWVAQFDWEKSARVVESAIKEKLADKSPPLATPFLQSRSAPAIDIVIPTYNGLEEIKRVIESLRRQKIADDSQIYCVDSSSTDGTSEWLSQQKDISLTTIDQKEFQHGRTRNAAAGLGCAAIIAFLTQDAVPKDDIWSYDILKMFEHFRNAAGLFGRHAPYPHHMLFVRQEINQHFERFLNHPLEVSRATDEARWNADDVSWRQFLHYYSDNNSAMRRTSWEEIPYPEVDFGEDQLWAKEIIERGFSKIYAPTACVFHSHEFSPAETYERSKTEGEFFHRYFGYSLADGTLEDVKEKIVDQHAEIDSWGIRYQQTDDIVAAFKAMIEQKMLGLRDGRLASERHLNASSV